MNFSLLTFNIHKGVSADGRRLVLPKIASLLQHVDTDIVCLQEIQGEHRERQRRFDDWPESSHLEHLAGEQWPYFTYGKNHCHQHGHHGNAMMSKFELKAVRNTNISASQFSNRGVLYSQVFLSPTHPPLHLFCTHLGLLRKEREMQLKQIKQLLNQLPDDEPLILAGDFNDWRQQASRQLGLSEIFFETTGHYAKTFPAKWPLLRLDRIYYRNLKPVDCEVIKTSKLSDHLPLYARFMAYTSRT